MVTKKGKKKVKKVANKKAKKKVANKKAKKKVAKKKTKKRSKKKVKKKPAHRPAKYEKEFAGRAERYIARYKMDYDGLADLLEVSVRTIYSWMKDKPKFAAAIERGKKLDAESLEHTARKLASPHDEVTVIYEGVKGKKRKEQVRERRVKKDVVSQNALFKVLAVDEPNRFGKRIAIDAGESITDIMAKVLSGGKDK